MDAEGEAFDSPDFQAKPDPGSEFTLSKTC